MPDETAETASQAILGLLGRHPDYEMQVNDVWEELGRKWATQTVSNQLTWLAGAGRVQRVKDGRQVWWSIKA